MTHQYLFGGVDISKNVDEETIEIRDALGQGAGTGLPGSGRAGTCEFVCNLGPISSAVGSGSHPTTPTLIRMGEVQIKDDSGTYIYGGYASTMTDVTERTTLRTKIDCVDYWQFLDRIVINELYDGNTDIFMIKDLLSKYAPFLDQSQLPKFASFTFGVKNFRHFTLQKALDEITKVTGHQFWIGFDKIVHYETPTNGTRAPFSLSDNPDFRVSFPFVFTDNEVDDTGTINRVYFYGGSSASGDFTQYLSTQCDGTNTVFTLAYYPHEAKDGAIHVKINGGADLVLGTAFGKTTKDILKSAGGLADVILDSGAKTLTFNTAYSAGTIVTCKYRYQNPLVVALVDQPSYTFFGRYLDGVIIDSSIFDKQQAVQRCRTLLQAQRMGLTTLSVSTWTPALRAGTILQVDHTLRGIHQKYVIQQVTTVPLGGGNFRYDIECGSWNWNVVDAILQVAQTAIPEDVNSTDSTTAIDIIQGQLSATHTLTPTSANYPTGAYYATLTALSDGKDAYAGYSSITS